MAFQITDEKRKHRAASRLDNRGHLEQLAARATYLPELDRALFEQSLEGHMTDERQAPPHRQ